VASLTSLFVQLAGHSAEGAIHYICGDWRGMRQVLDAGEGVYGELQNLIVWIKDAAGTSASLDSGHELVFSFVNSGSADAPDRKESRYQRDVWRHPGIPDLHVNDSGEAAMLPSGRPVAQVADAINASTEWGGIVLDPFCGLGTVLIASEKTGRRARALEADPANCDSAIRRWEAYAGGDAVLAETGESFKATQVLRRAEPR
jgi:hypothetical protein